MKNFRVLNANELTQIAGGIPIILGDFADNPFMGIGGGSGNPFVGLDPAGSNPFGGVGGGAFGPIPLGGDWSILFPIGPGDPGLPKPPGFGKP